MARSPRASAAGRELMRLARGILDLESRLDAAGPGEADAPGWPRVELLELPGRLRVVIDLPGVAPRSLRVELRGRELRLRGERRERRPAGTSAARLTERPQGRFARALALPREVSPGRARARLAAGRLTVDLPDARPRAFRLRVGERGGR